MNGELFDIPECPSPKLAWMRQHNVLTHHAPHCEEDPWMAIIPMEGHKGDIGEIMAEWCGLYDEMGLIGYGKTKYDAMIDMAVKNNLKLWNQQ